jgi:plasmid stabilization system protein ParE
MKSHKVVFTEAADECLLNIAEYIAQDNPIRAETFIEEIIVSLRKTLSVFPLAGTRYEDIDIEIRRLPYKNYVSFYRVTNNVVEILFVFNSAQDIKGILKAMGELHE